DPFADWAPYLARHVAAVRDVLTRADADGRVYALTTLGRLGFDFAPIVDLLVQIGTGPAKTPRDAALPLLLPLSGQARPHIEHVLTAGDAGARHEAVQLLWRLDGEKAADRLRRHAEQESSERVKQTITR